MRRRALSGGTHEAPPWPGGAVRVRRRSFRGRRAGGREDRRHLRLHRRRSPPAARRPRPSATRSPSTWSTRRAASRATRSSPIYADAQSKTDVAINEAERLLNDAKVDLLMGVYSSAHCVPMAAKVDAAKKFMWANVCVASAVLQGQEPAIRVPPAGAFRPVRRGLLHVHRRERQGEARARRSRTSRSPSSTRTAPTASASPWATRPSARSSACRSCTRRATPRPRPISRRSSPSCAARSPTSSCTPATTPTSRCSCASPRRRA